MEGHNLGLQGSFQRNPPLFCLPALQQALLRSGVSPGEFPRRAGGKAAWHVSCRGGNCTPLASITFLNTSPATSCETSPFPRRAQEPLSLPGWRRGEHTAALMGEKSSANYSCYKLLRAVLTLRISYRERRHNKPV